MMKYRAFDGFGVEVYKGAELVRTHYSDSILDAIEFASSLNRMYTCHFITVDKWCRKIDDID